MPQTTLMLRLAPSGDGADLSALLIDSGSDVAATFAAHRHLPGIHLLLTGDRDYYVVLSDRPSAATLSALTALRGKAVAVIFPGRTAVRRRLADLAAVQTDAAAGESPDDGSTGSTPPPPIATGGATGDGDPLRLNVAQEGAAPLFLMPSGAFSDRADSTPTGMAAQKALVTAARWISTRRTSTFERLFPPSAFHPDLPLRGERLTAAQAQVLLAQVQGALAEAAVGGPAATADSLAAAQVRSAGLTVLSHIVATARKDRSFVDVAHAAADAMLALIDREQVPAQGMTTARAALRAHAIQLLQMRAPALSSAQRDRVTALLRGSIRQAPPYSDAQLQATWRFAMCSAWDFHDGECELLVRKYGFKEIAAPTPAPTLPLPVSRYRILEAPFRNPAGQPIQIYSRTASPSDENREMACGDFIGVLINRHAQLGAFDMQASATDVRQVGYKLMMNSQCAGLTTRFAIAKMFPDADIYSSWDSTYFRTDPTSHKVTDSEGLDCFVALLMGMSRGETHAQISTRMQGQQWHHEQSRDPNFMQFVGPAHPNVVARYSDVNQDGHADFYDGFLDFTLADIKSDLENSATPRDPGVAASQIGGDAAKGLGWAAGSMNRVTQYSDLWSGLPGDSELFYIFSAGGFFSHREPPQDVPVAAAAGDGALGLLPAVCRYVRGADGGTGRGGADSDLRVDVMFHSHLAHAAWELKRLLCAADAHRRALDLGMLPSTGLMSTLQGQRGAMMLMLAGLLEFPADQNYIDGLWNMALRMLNLPPVSRSIVRRCINEADHDASNYYGSQRGLRQLIGERGDGGDLGSADPPAFQKLVNKDPTIGRPLPLALQ